MTSLSLYNLCSFPVSIPAVDILKLRVALIGLIVFLQQERNREPVTVIQSQNVEEFTMT